MDPTHFLIAAAALMVLRLLAQWWARGHAPAGPARGGASVLLWLVIYGALLAGAVVEIGRSGRVDASGAAVFFLSLGLRFAGLHALRGKYHEAIVVQEAHGVVRSGVYRFLRHPLHLALLAEMAGLALLCGRLWTVAFVVLALLLLLHRNRQEEKVLSARLGVPYRDYLEGPAWDLIDLLPGRRESRSVSESQTQSASQNETPA